MYTYIIASQGLHKIGRAKNAQKRIKSLQIGNPFIEIIKIIEGDHELYLHRKYKEKRVTGEWFKLTEEDISSIDINPPSIESQKPDANTNYQILSRLNALVDMKILQPEEVNSIEKDKYTKLSIYCSGKVVDQYISPIDGIELVIDIKPGNNLYDRMIACIKWTYLKTMEDIQQPPNKAAFSFNHSDNEDI